ncbi:MAG: SIMPL domain-containing protein [Prevotellaceae bacterium]|nr:SIMPL domain-containing protein [Prevotellaceae bacterium]
MKKILFFAAASLLAISAKTQSGGKNFIDQPYIEVRGSSEKEITPNEIYLKIIINEKDNKAERSLEQLERDMIAVLSKLGVNVPKDLTIKDLSSSFTQHWYKKSDIFSAKEYQLLVHSAAMAGKTLREFEALGVSNISISRVDHSEIEKFRREVKIEAMKDAKSKASDLLQAIGHKVGAALWVMELDYTPVRFTPPALMRTMKSSSVSNEDSESLPEAEFEKIKLEYSVTARFAIAP